MRHSNERAQKALQKQQLARRTIENCEAALTWPVAYPIIRPQLEQLFVRWAIVQIAAGGHVWAAHTMQQTIGDKR
jgi:hypothetical protein